MNGKAVAGYFEEHAVVKGDQPLPVGEATVTVDFAYQGGRGEAGKGADITLSVNGDKVAEGKMEATVAGRFGADRFGLNILGVPEPSRVILASIGLMACLTQRRRMAKHQQATALHFLTRPHSFCGR